jgi:hypothetical protein
VNVEQQLDHHTPIWPDSNPLAVRLVRYLSTPSVRDVAKVTASDRGDHYAIKELLDHSSTGVTEGLPPSKRTAPLGRMVERQKAPSGLEPLYEALQASA